MKEKPLFRGSIYVLGAGGQSFWAPWILNFSTLQQTNWVFFASVDEWLSKMSSKESWSFYVCGCKNNKELI